MKILISLVFTLHLIPNSYAQVSQPPREYYNEDFQWTIIIPEGFENIPSEEWNKMENKGKDAIEGTYDIEVENNTTSIFNFKSDQFNYFGALWQPYDVELDGDYKEVFQGVNEILYGTFKNQMPSAKIDTASSMEDIDHLPFYKFKIQIALPNQMVLTMLMYSRLFDKKELTVNFVYVNPEKGNMMMEALKNSKFARWKKTKPNNNVSGNHEIIFAIII